jgi:hypothetical protein
MNFNHVSMFLCCYKLTEQETPNLNFLVKFAFYFYQEKHNGI